MTHLTRVYRYIYIYIFHITEKKNEMKILKRLETAYDYIDIYIVAVEHLKLK